MDESERRQALANFLRRRRTCLTPADVGLPAGTRRRTPGLRREEVAQLANIGTSWYVWLEQGRDVHPSAQVLESLALALKLTQNERRHLFLLAGYSPPHASPLDENVSPALQQVLDDLNPTPAYVTGQRWDYLAWNRAADCFFDISGAPPPYERNVIWRLFTDPKMRENPHWEKIARGMLAELRTASMRYPGDRWFEDLIEDLKRVSPEFCLWWPHHDAWKSADGYKRIVHKALGTLEFEHITLQVLNNPNLRIIIYTPLGTTRQKMQQLLEMDTAKL